MRKGWTALTAVLTVAACGGEGAEPPQDGQAAQEVVADAPASRGADIDRALFEEKIQLARTERLDTLPINRIIVRVGESFIGTPYTPGTLEVEGPERLVVNLRELDCVTYVENVLALARVIRSGETTFDAFLRELQRIRYRDGTLAGYPSRLHYFSEWIQNNQELGLVRDVSRQIGGQADPEVIDFMSRNADKYPALADSSNLNAIRRIEARLSSRPRYFVPEDRIADVASAIEEGDIIAATSSIRGLDIAHTGFAVMRDGQVHLMHAPLVGDSVHVSPTPLAQRILGIDGQDGIMVARPL
mgnify:CR=1 FL=1